VTDIVKRGQVPAVHIARQMLIVFLNLGDKPKTKREKYFWKVDPYKKFVEIKRVQYDKSFVEVKRVQLELRQILIPLTNPKKRPSLDETGVLVQKLVKKFKPRSFGSKWDVTVWLPSGQKKGLLTPEEEEMEWAMTVTSKAGRTIWVNWLIRPREKLSLRGIEGWAYGMLKNLLEWGGMEQLKSCPECQRFFAAQDSRKDFCSTPCRTNYNNSRRKELNYFQNRRKEERRRDLNRARRLLKEGKSPEELVLETGLSLRVLRREGLVK